jgi:hypothetical protein
MRSKKIILLLSFVLVTLLISNCGFNSKIVINQTSATRVNTNLKTQVQAETTIIPSLLQLESPLPTKTPTFVRTIQSSPSVATTNKYFSDLINLKSLPPGQYITYYSYANSSLMAMSFQGQRYPIFKSDREFEFGYSQNTRFLISSSDQKVINIFDQKVTFTSTQDLSECIVDHVSGNGLLVSDNCGQGGISIYDESMGWTPIFLPFLSISQPMQPSISNQGSFVSYCHWDDGSKTKFSEIAHCYKTSSCQTMDMILPFDTQNGVAWHPNGEWIAGVENYKRAYILSLVTGEMKIIQEDVPCNLEQDIAWSPDGNWVVFDGMCLDQKDPSAYRMYLYLYSVRTGVTQIFEEQSESSYQLAGWLNIHSDFHAGGKYVVLPREDELFLLSTYGEGGEPVHQLHEKDVITILDQYQDIGEERWWLVESDNRQGWILETMDFFQDDWESDLKPAMFQIGSHLVITTNGEDLRLRETASINGEIIRKLQPGVRLSIANGPEKVDGYTWWKVILDQSNIEGWVAEDSSWFGSIPEE